MQDTPSLFFSSKIFQLLGNKKSGFNVTCMLKQIAPEILLAEKKLALIRNETAEILTPPKRPKPTRQRRGAIMRLAALDAVGLFGGGLAIACADSCAVRVIFGICQDQSKANAENVRRLADSQYSLTDYVAEFLNNTDEMFFLLEN